MIQTLGRMVLAAFVSLGNDDLNLVDAVRALIYYSETANTKSLMAILQRMLLQHYQNGNQGRRI